MADVAEEKYITCIGCPKGCQIKILKKANGEITAEDFFCKKGQEYAIQEYKDPKRILTTTLKVQNGQLQLIPVRSNLPIPKNRLIDCMNYMADVEIKAPIKMGDVLISNILNLNVDIISSRDLETLQ